MKANRQYLLVGSQMLLYMNFKRSLILVISFFLISQTESQTLFIKNGKKKIKILVNAKIEILTLQDTSFTEQLKTPLPFIVSKLGTDSIEILRPTIWKDTFSYKFNPWTGKDITRKKKYYKVPASYETHQFALAEISKIRYTYQRDQSGEGCLGCMIVPGLNIYYFWTKARKTKEFDMKSWHFVWE